MEHIGESPSAAGYVSLDSVGESVHTRSGGKSRGHRGHHIGVNDCNDGNVVSVNANELALLLNVGNNVVDSYLSRSTCGGGNCDYRNAGVLCGSNALERANVLVLGVGDDDTDSLSGVHRRASADSHDRISLCSLERRNSVLYVLNSGVRLDVGVHGVLDACRVKKIGHLSRNAELYKVGVGGNEYLFEAAAVDLGHYRRDSACSVIGGFIEHKLVHNFFPFRFVF